MFHAPPTWFQMIVGESSNTVPMLLGPPPNVVPYRMLPEKISPADGLAPSVPLKVANTVGVPPVAGTEYTTPSPKDIPPTASPP